MSDNLLRMMISMKKTVMVLLLTIPMALSAAVVQKKQDPDTGLLSWSVEDRGLSLELIQLPPDYIRAVYSSRGLPKYIVEDMALYCVFGTIIKNLSDTQLSYRVADWRYVTADGKAHALKTKTQWLTEWRKGGIKFAWTLLPDDQVFDVGDWSQGFTTMKLPRESTFDLVFYWKLEEKTHAGKIENLSCAAQD
jgi:hypothetical protein